MRSPPGKTGRFPVTAWILACMFFIPALCMAEIFKYVSNDGVIHFTNLPTQSNFQKVRLNNSLRIGALNPCLRNPSKSLCDPSLNRANQLAYEPYIKLSCRRHGLDFNLVKAVIRAESAFNPQAVSPKGAMGLMQLMPDTSRDMGVGNPFDPYENIQGGSRYLKLMLNRFDNNIVHALAAYNAGPEAVEKHGGIPPFEETQTYIQRVLELYSHYKR
ncbi:MAG: transglycosylase SLT domain-containing protein [Syntrophobacteraceae bacterium]